MAGLTQQEINTFEAKRVGFWQMITGKTGDDLLEGIQDILSAAGILSDQLANIQALLSGVSPSSLPQPYSQTVPTVGNVSGNAQYVVDYSPVEVAANATFGNFTAQFDGTATIHISLSNGGILSKTVSNNVSSTTAEMNSGDDIGTVQWNDFDFSIRDGLTYSFQSDTAGIAAFYVLAAPDIGVE